MPSTETVTSTHMVDLANVGAVEVTIGDRGRGVTSYSCTAAAALRRLPASLTC